MRVAPGLSECFMHNSYSVNILKTCNQPNTTSIITRVQLRGELEVGDCYLFCKSQGSLKPLVGLLRGMTQRTRSERYLGSTELLS